MGKKDAAKALAKELYLNTTKTQKDIGLIVDVSQKTMSDWVTENGWDALKEMQSNTPERIVADLYAELDEINKAIKAKPAGERFADAKQADARRKTIACIRDMAKEVALPQYVQVLVDFIEDVQHKDLELAKRINPIINDFLLSKASKTNKL